MRGMLGRPGAVLAVLAMTTAAVAAETEIVTESIAVEAIDVAQTNTGVPPERVVTIPPAIGPQPRNLVRCPRSADPRRRYFECKSNAFDSIYETLSGDWNRARDDLKRAGITPTASYAGAYFGASGGGGTSPTYAGQLTAAVHVELDKAVGAWQGFSFYVSGIWAQQSNDGSFLNNNLFPSNSLAAGRDSWLAEMYFQQTLLDGNLTLAAGRLAPGVTFATLPVFGNYLNAAVAGNPGALATNDPVFPGPPTNTQWAAQALYNITPEWQVAGGWFNNNPNAAAGLKHGANFVFRQGNVGSFLIGQVNYLYNQAPGAAGMPGQYTFGAFYDTNNFQNLATGANEKNNLNWYALAQQQVTRVGGAGSTQGLTVWGAATYATKQTINLNPWQLGAGLSYQGLVPGRVNDITSLGWFYGRVSNTQPGATAQQVAELNYQYVVNGYLTLIADFQYLWRLNGLSSPGAAVVGVQAAITF